MTDQPAEQPEHRVNLGPAGNVDIDNWFTYHPPTAEQIPMFEAIRAKGGELAVLIADLCPHSPDRSTALREVRNAVMWANAAIACAPPPPAADTVEVAVSGPKVRCDASSGQDGGFDRCIRQQWHDANTAQEPTLHVDEMGHMFRTGGTLVGRMPMSDLRDLAKREGTGVRV